MPCVEKFCVYIYTDLNVDYFRILIQEMCDIIQSCENRNVQGNTNIFLFLIVVFSYIVMSLVMFSIEQYNHVYTQYIPVAKVQST